MWAATISADWRYPVRFRISYFLRESAASLKVAADISHEDQEDVMRANGLL